MKFEINVEDDFIEQFTSGGSSEVLCQCGRNHVAMRAWDGWDNDDDFDIAEAKLQYEEQAEKDDMLILNYEYDSIGVMEVGGVIFVPECECEGWKPYMKFMVDNRRDIAEFLLNVSEEIKKLQKYENVYDVLADVNGVPREYTVSS